jgi:phage shock protein A
MGIFKSIRDNLRHQLNQVVEGVEQRNVAAVYEAAIDHAVRQTAEYRSRLAGLVVMRDKTRDELTAREADLKQVLAGVQGAVTEGDDDTALVLISRKEELTAELEDKARLLTQLTDQVEEAKRNLAELRAGVPELQREKEQAVANKVLAEARIDIDESMTGLSDQAHIKGLDSVRESIGRLERQANPGYIDGEGHSVRGRAEAMGRKAKEASARAQLEALKRELRGETEPPTDDD